MAKKITFTRKIRVIEFGSIRIKRTTMAKFRNIGELKLNEENFET